MRYSVVLRKPGQFLLFSLIFFTSTAQNYKPVLTDNRLKTNLDSAIHYAASIYMLDSNANGISIGVYRKGKKHTYNYGEAKKGTGLLPSANNFYNIGSVAKTFVATILAQAAIDKMLNLDDDIRKYLPDQYPNLEYEGQPIRFVNLANHTSGLPAVIRTFSQSVRDSLRKLSISEQVDFYSQYDQARLLNDLHDIKLGTLPGVEYRYNSSAMMLLILLLERVYHRPYEEVVTNYLMTHLRMYNTKPFLSLSEIKGVVQGYNNSGKPQEFLNLRGFYLGPTMNSTVNDMLKYIEANLSEKDKAIKLTHQLTWGKENGFGIGLGWMIDYDNKGERYVYHDGNTKIGYNTLCIFYPGKDLGFIIIVNDTIDQDKVGKLENDILKVLHKM